MDFNSNALDPTIGNFNAETNGSEIKAEVKTRVFNRIGQKMVRQTDYELRDISDNKPVIFGEFIGPGIKRLLRNFHSGLSIAHRTSTLVRTTKKIPPSILGLWLCSSNFFQFIHI